MCYCMLGQTRVASPVYLWCRPLRRVSMKRFFIPPDLYSAAQREKKFVCRRLIKEKHVENNLTFSIFYLEVLWSCYIHT